MDAFREWRLAQASSAAGEGFDQGLGEEPAQQTTSTIPTSATTLHGSQPPPQQRNATKQKSYADTTRHSRRDTTTAPGQRKDAKATHQVRQRSSAWFGTTTHAQGEG